MNIKKNTIILFFILLSPALLNAQNNTSSPYSFFGLGDLSNIAYGRNLALGGTGYALRASSYINLKNPASLTAIDSLSTLYETGVFGKFTENTAADQSSVFWDGNITHITLAHRYTPWLMGNYGLMPYSDIGYTFRTEKSVQGENTAIITQWNGTGGINRLFYGLGFKVNENFSLGAEAAYYYGPINQYRRTTAVVEPGNQSMYYANTSYSGFSYLGAFQFSKDLGDKGSNITLGGTYKPAQQFTGNTTVSIQQSYGSSEAVQVYNDESSASPINIPVTYGGGLAFIWQNKYMLSGDYEFGQWSDNPGSDYVDRGVYSFGLERLPQTSLKYFDRVSYRIGFNYDSGYFNIRGYNVDDYRLTMGLGLPVQKSRSTINVTLEAGQRGTSQMGLIRERYAKFTVAFSFHDYWFVQRKID